MSDWHDDDNENARIAFGELDLRDRLAAALLDENGFRPTAAALDVLVYAMVATDRTDTRWDERDLPGSPSVTDYAAAAIDTLKRKFSAPGVIL